MYCRNCGAELSENAIVCSQCGQMQNTPFEAEPNGTPFADPVQEEQKTEKARNAFIFGLLSFIFALEVPPVGFILSFVAKSRVNEYIRLFGEPTGRARLGSIFAKVGFIVGLVQTIAYVFVISMWALVFLLEYAL